VQGSAGEGEQNAASVIASEAKQFPTRDVEIASSQKTLLAMTDGNAVAREERALYDARGNVARGAAADCGRGHCEYDAVAGVEFVE